MKDFSAGRFIFKLILILIPAAMLSGCIGMAASAEEYFSIGMAYFELGKFDEAEKWLNRASSAKKTMVASEYNLGRIAFETQRYRDAAKHFDAILRRDPDNVLALKAAAYTRIKLGEIHFAEAHYSRLLTLVPESADDGYNHALVLYAMERYSDAEKVLERYPYVLPENKEMMLLYARCLYAQNRVEAIDIYAKWLEDNTDKKVSYEYAQILERYDLYARALEEYRQILPETEDDDEDPKRSDIRFTIARLLLIADSESDEGITELETAIKEGFDDIEAVEELQSNLNISAVNRDSLREIINNMQRKAEQGRDGKDQAEEDTEDFSESEAERSPD